MGYERREKTVSLLLNGYKDDVIALSEVLGFERDIKKKITFS